MSTGTGATCKLSDIAAQDPNALCIGPFGSDLLASDFVASGVPVVFVRNVRAGWFNREDLRYITLEKAEKLRAHRVRGGDIVVTKMGLPPCIAAVYPEDAPDGVVTADIIKLTPDRSRVEPRYLVYFLNSPTARRQVERFTFGVTRPKVTLRDFRSLRIVLPPLPKQRRIADILDRADAIRRKRREAIALTEELLRSTFLEMFGDPVRNLRGWESRPLTALCQSKVYGTAEKANSERDGTPVVRMNNITYDGDLDLSDLKWVPLSDREREKLDLCEGDLLFNRVNSRELVGKTAAWHHGDGFTFAGYLIRLRMHPRLANADYVSGAMNSQSMKRVLWGMAKTSINMANISASDLERIHIPVPPLELQKKYGQLVHATRTFREKLRCAEAEAKSLFDSFVRETFSDAPLAEWPGAEAARRAIREVSA